MPLVPYPNPQKVGKIQKKFGFFPYKSKNDGLQEKTYRPSHLVRPQGLVGSPKASVIASHASCLAKKDKRQPGVPGFATQCVVQHSCKVPDDIKKQQPCCCFLVLYDGTPSSAYKKTTALLLLFGASSGTRTLDPLIKSQLLYQLS